MSEANTASLGGTRSPWPFLCLFIVPALIAAAAWKGGLWWLAMWAFTLAVLPAIDALAGLDPYRADDNAPLREPKRSAFTLIILAYVPVQLAVSAYVLWVAADGDLAWWNRIGLAASLGLANGAVGFTLAHELIHRAGFEFFMGRILLLGLAYPHYAVEHVRGHHRYVGTPRDPAFAKFGESFARFWPRSVFGQASSAWRYEAERLAKLGKPAFSSGNDLLRWGVAEIVLLVALGAWLGWLGLGLFFVHVLFAVQLLEAANYAQHYGLARREIAPGRYEPQTPRHSWSTHHRVTNWHTIELGRHADHHAQPGRPYQHLRTPEASPQLPASYGAMIAVAMIPPLWFRIMNPRVLAWRAAGEPALPGEANAA